MLRTAPQFGKLLRWEDVYRESELYKSALRVFTKPLFHWRKALFTSSDGRTLYDLAARGLANLDAIHRALQRQAFEFRPAVALRYRFNGKDRTLFVYPWEERIVDLLLYRLLTRRLQAWFSPNSYAYRERWYGLDRCQSRIAAVMRSPGPIYAVKRDIRDYFASIDHELLLQRITELVEPRDYLFRLLDQRVRFPYQDRDGTHVADRGVPFGTAVACSLANVYLTELDRRVEVLPAVHYFRYADDILLLSHDGAAAAAARTELERGVSDLRLVLKHSHGVDVVMGGAGAGFAVSTEIRHLGLQFRADGFVGLSREKCRKIQNLFRFAFRRGRRRWQKQKEPRARATVLAEIARESIGESVRNVAIIDYYLKHVNDEARLRLLDRGLAEEVLSLVFGGHRKGNFARLSFADLRVMGLPSLLHRRRMILNGRLPSPFFVWQQEKAIRAFKGAVVRR